MADSITSGWDVLSKLKLKAAAASTCAASASHAARNVPAAEVLEDGVPACGPCAESHRRES